MGDALIVSNALLWIVVVVLSGVVLALLRQVGVLHERVAPAGALVGRGGPRVGEPAPVLEVEDWSGCRLRVGGAGDASTLVCFVSPGCPVCKTLLPVVRRLARDEARTLRVVLASDGPAAEHRAFVREAEIGELPYLLGAELGIAYRVGKLPHAALLDGAGVLRAQGLVNTREPLESLFEAKERGVASLDAYLRETQQEVA